MGIVRSFTLLWVIMKVFCVFVLCVQFAAVLSAPADAEVPLASAEATVENDDSTVEATHIETVFENDPKQLAIDIMEEHMNGISPDTVPFEAIKAVVETENKTSVEQMSNLKVMCEHMQAVLQNECARLVESLVACEGELKCAKHDNQNKNAEKIKQLLMLLNYVKASNENQNAAIEAVIHSEHSENQIDYTPESKTDMLAKLGLPNNETQKDAVPAQNEAVEYYYVEIVAPFETAYYHPMTYYPQPEPIFYMQEPFNPMYYYPQAPLFVEEPPLFYIDAEENIVGEEIEETMTTKTKISEGSDPSIEEIKESTSYQVSHTTQLRKPQYNNHYNHHQNGQMMNSVPQQMQYYMYLI